MLTIGILYLNFGLGAVVALSAMILRIGAMIADCPQMRGPAHVTAISIATGFAAIGAGGVLIIGASLAMIDDVNYAALVLALGFAALCLGLGFTHAIGMLRAALAAPRQLRPQPQAA